MAAESARVTTAAEARFRIDAPNAQPRNVTVIALDRRSEQVVQRLAKLSWSRATFLTASAFAGAIVKGDAFSVRGWLSDLAGRTKTLLDEVARADLVVMVATMGEPAAAAELIGEACRARNVMTTALVLGAPATAESLDTLAQVRPHVMMLVAASSEEYIEDMLTALRS
jgi:thiamine monophosphate kinase